MDVMNLKMIIGAERFPQLKTVMYALLSLSHSNADCERVFSQVRKIHTEFRKSIAPHTLTALKECKIHIDGCCDFKPDQTHLSLARKATSEYNADH